MALISTENSNLYCPRLSTVCLCCIPLTYLSVVSCVVVPEGTQELREASSAFVLSDPVFQLSFLSLESDCLRVRPSEESPMCGHDGGGRGLPICKHGANV